MKIYIRYAIAILLFILLRLSSSAQKPASAYDSLLSKAVLRSVVPQENGSPGVLVLYIQKKDDSIQVKTVYSSMKDFGYSIEDYINRHCGKYIAPLPNGFRKIVPVHYYYYSNDGVMHPPPDEALKQSLKATKKASGKVSAMTPAKIILFATIR